MLRRVFDAAGRLAGLKPNILLESRAPHTLLAMAEAGHGVAIFPSALQTFHRNLRIVAVTYRGKPLRWPLMMLWDRRRPLPQYATVFCEMLGEYYREVFPITRPNPRRTPPRSEALRAERMQAGPADFRLPCVVQMIGFSAPECPLRG